ncbi:MAG TPA: response regulator transcription factor [Terriglobia bacterium]|nr:response regulator transcription factor [Terriglobia bacterium]
MERVLIVDDDPDIVRLVRYNLSHSGFEVQTAATGREALELVQKQPPDLVVLDVMLPDVDGLEVCRTLRQQSSSRRIPILMLTARGEEIDRVVGFELGADDYVSKPFSPRELVLRVKSILRRSGMDRTDTVHVGKIQVFADRRQVFVGSSLIPLTAKEFDLLFELMKARGNVLTREVIMDRVWGYHGEATSRTLDTHVRRLREKLGSEGGHVETVRGVGYRISDELPSKTE